MTLSGTACVIAAITILTSAAFADDRPRMEPTIVPRPAELEVLPGSFQITPTTAILIQGSDPELYAVAEYLAEHLRARTGQPLPLRELSGGDQVQSHITFGLTGDHASSGPDESYELLVTPERVTLCAHQPRGLFLGVQTIRQLLPPESSVGIRAARPGAGSIPAVRIDDRPRYRWRGMLLDCGRHFMDKEFVKRYIDLLAYHKMNVLHWHLTEDQGWRIEIRKYPRLTGIGAWRGDGDQRYGGFYTQADIREIVAYAKSRYVTIVPEIELPGHSVAALAAYPELSCTGGPFEVATRWGVHSEVYCAGNDQTFAFLEDVLSEVIELFPSEFIHIGGDECPKERWKVCPKCQARIKAEGLNDEHELQSYFIRRIEKFLNSKGKRLVGWDEILEGGLAPNATVQSWRGLSGAVAAATAGHDVICSPTSHCYLDYAQLRHPDEPTRMGFIDLQTAYVFEPTPAELTPEQVRHVLGAEGNMWTEHAPQQRVDWQVFPRLCALAEVMWSPAKLREWGDFSRRMQTHYRRLDGLGVTYFIPPPRCSPETRVFTRRVQVRLTNASDRGAMYYTVDGSEPTQESLHYQSPTRFTKTTTIKARTCLDNGRCSAVVEYRFRKLEPHEPVAVADPAPGLTYKYYEGSWRRLPEFGRLSPKANGDVATFDLGVRRRDAQFGLVFSGFIEVPVDTIYTFYLTSDDGSRLWIGSELVIDHDGLHAASEEAGYVILNAGKHPITVECFQAGGPARLEVHWQRKGTSKQPVSAWALWHSQQLP